MNNQILFSPVYINKLKISNRFIRSATQDYLADDFGTDIYVAQVGAANESDAVSAAQHEAFDSDTKDEMEPNAPDDYALCVLFEGRHDPKLFGWQDY